ARHALGNFQCGNAFAEVTRAAVDFAELFLAIGVFGVLRAIAFGGCRGEGLHHFRAQYVPQVVEFGLEPFEAVAGDDRGGAGRGRAPAAHAGLASCRRWASISPRSGCSGQAATSRSSSAAASACWSAWAASARAASRP